MIFGSLVPINFVAFLISLISFPNDGLVAFHYSSYGILSAFKSFIIFTVVLPTTEIIEA